MAIEPPLNAFCAEGVDKENLWTQSAQPVILNMSQRKISTPVLRIVALGKGPDIKIPSATGRA